MTKIYNMYIIYLIDEININLFCVYIGLTKEEKMRKQKGITLIALVITIVVLLILAAVSITAITDEDKGVVTKAKDAAKKTGDAAEQEDDDIKEIMHYAES